MAEKCRKCIDNFGRLGLYVGATEEYEKAGEFSMARMANAFAYRLTKEMKNAGCISADSFSKAKSALNLIDMASKLRSFSGIEKGIKDFKELRQPISKEIIEFCRKAGVAV